MWDGFDVPGLRHELRGSGSTPLPPTGSYSDADDLIEALGGEAATLVGSSFGAWVCLQVAVAHPELVSDLVLLGAPLPDHDWSAELRAHSRQEEGLLEQGDLHGAAIVSADFWLEAPEPRRRVIEMQQRSYELQSESEAEAIEPETVDLGAIAARTLVAVGQLDKRDFHEIADRLVAGIAGAERAVIAGAGHLPSLEKPRETAALVRNFLADKDLAAF